MIEGYDIKIDTKQTLFKSIKEIREGRFESITDRYEIDEDENNIIISVPNEIKSINLVNDSNQIIMNFENKNFSIIISKDESNRIITFYLNGEKIELALIDSRLCYEYLNHGDEEYIRLSIACYGRDITIDNEQEVYSYPIFDTEIIEIGNNKCRGTIKSTLFPFSSKVSLISKEGEFNDVLLTIGHYRNLLNKSRVSLIKLVTEENIIIYHNDKLYRFVQFDDFYLIVKEIDNDNILLSIPIVEILDSANSTVINESNIIIYKEKAYSSDDIDEYELRNVIGTDYSSSIFNKLCVLYKNINDNYTSGINEVATDLSSKFYELYDELKNSNLGDKIVYYLEVNTKIFDIYSIDSLKSKLKMMESYFLEDNKR